MKVRPPEGCAGKDVMQKALALSLDETQATHPSPRRDAVTLSRKLEAIAKLRTAQAPSQVSQNVVQLPLWGDDVRGVPNSVLRAALFGVITKGLNRDEKRAKEVSEERKRDYIKPPRTYLERQEIRAPNGIRIYYTGARLDQGDLDVWETVLHIARVQALGDVCRITAYQLLKALGKTDTGNNRDTLERRLSRMNATALDVKVDKFSYEGSLIDEVYRAEESREYVIRLNPKLLNLFADDQFTLIDWSVRHDLDGKPFAQWLHGYYSSHANPLPVSISLLLMLSGSENTTPRSNRQSLRKAMNALTEACNKNGQPFSYEIHGDLVHVKKTPSKSQKKHLAKKKLLSKKEGKS